MTRFLGRRLILLVVTLFLVSLLTFYVIELLPGDAATFKLGQDATPENLVKTTMYVVGYRESMQDELFAGIINAAAKNSLPLVPITLVGVQSLFLDAALIEIEGVAVLAD